MGIIQIGCMGFTIAKATLSFQNVAYYDISY